MTVAVAVGARKTGVDATSAAAKVVAVVVSARLVVAIRDAALSATEVVAAGALSRVVVTRGDAFTFGWSAARWVPVFLVVSAVESRSFVESCPDDTVVWALTVVLGESPADSVLVCDDDDVASVCDFWSAAAASSC